MPVKVYPETHTGITAELLKLSRRRTSAVGSPVGLQWKHDEFTLLSSPGTTYTLSFLPYGINHVALNGIVLRYGVDYTVDYSDGTVDVSDTIAADDVLQVSYVTTGFVSAERTIYTDCETVTDNFNRADAGDGTLGTADTGQRWFTPAISEGTWTTQGSTVNKAQAEVAALDHYRTMIAGVNANGNNQDLTVTLSSDTDDACDIYVRNNATFEAGYAILVSQYSAGIYKHESGGTGPLLQSLSTIAGATEVTVRVVVKNAILSVYYDGVLQQTVDIPPDDAGGLVETDWTYLGIGLAHGGPSGSAPSTYPVNTNTHQDNLSVVAPS